MPFLEEIEGDDADYKEDARKPASQNDVNQPIDAAWVEDHCPKIGDHSSGLGPSPFNSKTCRGLHPGVGDDDPNGAEMGPRSDANGGEVVDFRAHFFPAEEHQSHKSCFEEEGKNALSPQRTAENVADIVGVMAPIRSEAKELDQSGCNTKCEGQCEDFDPKFGHFEIDGIFRFDVDSLDDHEEQAQPNAQGRVDIMKHAGQRELNPREKNNIHVDGSSANSKFKSIRIRARVHTLHAHGHEITKIPNLDWLRFH